VALTAALALRGVQYRYPETERDAIDGIDLAIAPGDWVGVVGPTNAGKSTLCYLAMGLAPQFFGGTLRGEVSILGVASSDQTVPERSKRVGLLFQNPFTQVSGARERVDEEVAFGPENHGLPRAEIDQRVVEALRLVGLEGLADRHPLDLSGGQLQRLALAGLLAMRPELLLLDEPTSQLDPAGSRALFEVLAGLHGRGVTILMVEQKLEVVAALCPRVLALDGGRLIADGPPQQVFNDAAVAASVGVPAFARLAQRAGLPAPWPVTLEASLAAFRG
jgi:energy-coupling factor transporter ATP-binding protein EcfA2